MEKYFNHTSGLFFKNLTEEETKWLEHVLALDRVEDADELEKTIPGVDPEWDWPGFEGSVHTGEDTPCLWVYTREDCDCIDNITALLQAFIQRFRPTEVASFTWAGTCDRPLAEEFGGGWVTVTATLIESGDTWAALKDAVGRLKAQGHN